MDPPISKRVQLSTGPEVGYTHWGQQVFYLRNCIETTDSETVLSGKVSIIRQEKNKRLYELHMDLAVGEGQSKSLIYESP